MPVCKEPFGVTRDGRPVDKFTLRRGALEAEILTYGRARRAAQIGRASCRERVCLYV